MKEVEWVARDFRLVCGDCSITVYASLYEAIENARTYLKLMNGKSVRVTDEFTGDLVCIVHRSEKNG